METYKIIKKHVTEEEVEVELPYYSKNICFAYKVISKEKSIKVCFSATDFGIKESYASMAFGDDMEKCTEEEFDNRFSEVSTRLQKIAGINPIYTLMKSFSEVLL